jgi:hypothetical protein
MKKYYYSNGVDRKGPVSLAELISSGVLTPGTLVWYEGLPSWVRADELPELRDVVSIPSPSGVKPKRAGMISKRSPTVLAVLSCIVLYFIWYICFYLFEIGTGIGKGDFYYGSASVSATLVGIYTVIKYLILAIGVRAIWKWIRGYRK